jgi:hypothetical protein
MVGLVALAVALHVLALGKAHLSTNAHQLEVFQVGTRAGMIFAGLAGALAITAEIRYGTIRPTFLVTPRRGPVIAAKLLVGALVGVIFGLLAEGLMATAATIAFSARGIPNLLESRRSLSQSAWKWVSCVALIDGIRASRPERLLPDGFSLSRDLRTNNL